MKNVTTTYAAAESRLHDSTRCFFPVHSLVDEKTLTHYNIQDNYTVYSTPNYVEISNQPQL